ncbi:hypothetical protein N7532_001604 [Penicillium argentinense]|uniref:Uncharacterized protein n=1 Tax=Penicillium argentinense TaxID=1131581 RepID=A0A9W9G2S4_9EURO|nr:uncharacterized protein N7532_001604 [Penicillium argentinense]KAJ5111069.1 hypothetical protein N7532_001604 [Penicillium argentinense]
MKLAIFAMVLTWISSAVAAPAGGEIGKRNPSGEFKLVAYGVASSYIDVFFSDGLAYAGDSSLWKQEGNVVTDVTFTMKNTELVTTATTPGVTLDASTLFYIRPTSNEVLPVGFTENGTKTPSDAVTDSFIFYGTYLMWEQTGGALSDSFRLKPTNISGVYQLYYDYSNTYPSGYLLPVVKSKDV